MPRQNACPQRLKIGCSDVFCQAPKTIKPLEVHWYLRSGKFSRPFADFRDCLNSNLFPVLLPTNLLRSDPEFGALFERSLDPDDRGSGLLNSLGYDAKGISIGLGIAPPFPRICQPANTMTDCA